MAIKWRAGPGTSAVSRGGLVRTVARVLQEPSLPLRVAAKKMAVGGFELRCDLDLFPRPQYAYGVQQAALLARSLGIPAVSVVEFGVAGGNGLLELERVARLATDALGVRIDVHGFDRGAGLPEPHGYRDLPYRWMDGFFEMDVDALERRLTTAELILGDLSATVSEFASRPQEAPVGFVAVDLDYYSSTVDAFTLFAAEATRLLPRVWCYLDDIIGDDVSLHNEYVGELAAVADFNRANAQRKIAPIYGLTRKRIWPATWCDQMFALHCFDHDDYCTYVGPPAEGETLRLSGS